MEIWGIDRGSHEEIYKYFKLFIFLNKSDFILVFKKNVGFIEK